MRRQKGEFRTSNARANLRIICFFDVIKRYLVDRQTRPRHGPRVGTFTLHTCILVDALLNHKYEQRKMDSDTRIEQPLLHDAEHILIDDDEGVDEIEEEKRELHKQNEASASSNGSTSSNNQSPAQSLSLSTSNPRNSFSMLSYTTSGLLGFIVLLVMTALVLSCVATVVNWFDVVLEKYVEGQSVHEEYTVWEVDLMDFLRFFYRSDCNGFWSFLITVTGLTMPFMRFGLQLVAIALLVDILIVRRQRIVSSDSNSVIQWASARWTIVRFQVFQLAPLCYKWTGTVLYVGAFFLAVASVDFVVDDVTFKVKIPFGAGGVLFYIAQFLSQIVNLLMMYKLNHTINTENAQYQPLDSENYEDVNVRDKQDNNDKTEIIDDEDEFFEFHDSRECVEVHPVESLAISHRDTLSNKTRMVASFLAALSLITGTIVWFIPLVSIDYDGLEANFMEGDLSEDYTIWALYWEAYKAVDSDMTAIAILGLFVIETIVLPVIALALSLALLESESRIGFTSRKNIALMLHNIRPFMNLESLVTAVILFGASIEQVAEYVFNDFEFCQQLGEKGASCLSINCKFLAGTWILLIYLLALTGFNILVLPVPKLKAFDFEKSPHS